MSIGDELKDNLHAARPHRLKGAVHQLCHQAWQSMEESRKALYESLRLAPPKNVPIPDSGPAQGILLQLLYEKYASDEITSWSPEIWKAAADQVHTKLLEPLLLAATSYECANPRAACALLETYRDTPEFKQQFLFHVNQFINATALSPGGQPGHDGFTHLNLERKPPAKKAGTKKPS